MTSLQSPLDSKLNSKLDSKLVAIALSSDLLPNFNPNQAILSRIKIIHFKPKTEKTK